MSAEYLRSLFPRLRDFTITSPETRDYNCIAWAAGIDDDWWWPRLPTTWPVERPPRATVDAFADAFASIGYEPSGDGGQEPGIEKLAIYAEGPFVTHMARQLPNGRWTSKLGRLEDIEHASPGELEGGDYGSVVQYLRRPRAG